MPLEKDLFPTTRSVEDLCFDFVIEDFIKVTSEMLHQQTTRQKYLMKVMAAKNQWLSRRTLRLEQELYLGSNEFDAELNRSCGEFYSEQRKVISYNPIRWYSIN